MAQPTAEVRATRRRLRALRIAIPPRERGLAEAAIHAYLLELPRFRRGARIAMYLPMPGEVDLRPCIEAARRRGIDLYVPRILSHRRCSMAFARLAPEGGADVNRYGIEEPAPSARRLPAIALDVVVVPVVGFDRMGNRLGMGAGYYDRMLRRRRGPARHWRRPYLVGVAFASQELPRIAASPWDVPLDIVVTERGVVVPDRIDATQPGSRP